MEPLKAYLIMDCLSSGFMSDEDLQFVIKKIRDIIL